MIAYERELIPQHLALTISKPFYFNKERFDTPFDFILKGLFRKGPWEDLELGYAYIPTGDIVENELSAALSGVYHF
jgi:hypothetical protein